MSKKKTVTKTKSVKTTKNAPPINNGLADALGFSGQNPYGSEQISQPDTIFKNLRWFFLSNYRQILSQVYVEIGLVQTIVDVPVDDALRGGIEIKSKQLDEDQIEELKIAQDRGNDLLIAAQAEKWNRLFGGAGILVITDQVPESPFKMDSITPDSPLEFRAVDMWELFWDKQNVEGFDSELQEYNSEFYNYYAKKLHESRVMKLKGLIPPSFVRPRFRGWGFSVVEMLVRSINQYMKATDLSFEVLDEFKLDIYKIKNLTSTLLSPNGDAKVRQRVMLANLQKNYQNAITMDSEDDYVQKQLSFAGLAEAMAGIRMQVASDMRMPLTKLFGISAAGFNSGEDDIEVYNSMVESTVRNRIKFPILRMTEIRCQQLFGFVPDDLQISFKPLRVMSSEQEETVKTQKFARLLQAKQAGEITRYEFREGVNKSNLLDISLDNTEDALNPDDPDIETMVAGDEAGKEADAEAARAAGNIPPQANEPEKKKSQMAAPASAPIAKAPDAPKPKNAADGEEGKHPRADDGKFGSGGGGSQGKKSKGTAAKAEPSQSFAGFSDTTEPKREGSRTEGAERLWAYTGANAGKKSAVEYKSPAASTCNLVGYVAFGKSSVKVQKELNECVQSAEIVLSELGVKFKTPLDFVCQNVTSSKKMTATYTGFSGKAKVNPRIDIKDKAYLSKSIMHEIGHAIDFALSERDGYASSSVHAGHTARPTAPPENAKIMEELHKELTVIFKASSFYDIRPDKRYLANPTEIFARSFEVYSYAKAKELAAAGKIPAEFVDTFKPDMFKTKNVKVQEMADGLKVAISELNKNRSALVAEKDPEKIKELETQNKTLREDYDKACKDYDVIAAETKGYQDIPEEKQKEYTDKISKLMSEVLAKDSIKNALANLFGNSLDYDLAAYEVDGGDSQFDERRAPFFENPQHVDATKWEEAKQACTKAFGKIKTAFVIWKYKQLGGKF